MKLLALGWVACLLVGQAACIIDSGGDDSSGAHMLVTWSLEALATQSPQPCPVGYDTAAVYSQPIDAAQAPVGDPVIDLFNCSDGSGLTSTLTGGTTYSVTVAIATDDNALQYGTSTPVVADVTAEQLEVDTPPIYTDGGHFKLTWQLEQGGGMVACAAVPNATSIGVTATDSDGVPHASPPFACTDAVGYTGGVLDGAYTVAVALLDASDAPLGSAAPIQASVMTTATMGNAIASLGTVTVDVAP